MATAGGWRIYGAVSGYPSGVRAVDVTITASTTAIDSSILQTINGFASVTVPANATAVLIIPPSANTNTITLKGITGDTGVALSKVLPTVLALAAGATFGLTTGASTAIQIIFM